MSEERELVVLMTKGTDHETSSVGFTIANGGMTTGFKKVTVFLTSSAVDLARRRAIDTTHVPPLEPLAELVKDFLRRGGRLVACTPCVKARGYTQQDLIEGTEIAGSSVIHERLLAGAASLSF
ncbi:MAG: DsrE family protein [Myxococcaceae bacterium]